MKRFIALLLVLACGPLAAQDEADTALWESLRRMHFGDRPIAPAEGLITLEAPQRAADPAVVPISIRADRPQDQKRIRAITVLIDKNPTPLAGAFRFGPASARADLDLRIRINEYSWVRAIAETEDGKLYMARRFVKASGGCAAPVGTDLEAAMARLGQIRLRPGPPEADMTPVQLRVSHPNITGLQMDQLTLLYMPAHYVQNLEVTLDGEAVLSARTDISISENPSIGFRLPDDARGELRVEVEDSKGLSFTRVETLGG